MTGHSEIQAHSLLEMPDYAAFANHIGIDEAGRGCLAGPVVAAAVLLAPETVLPGLGDSKSRSAALRERLAPQIKANSLAWGIGVSWPQEIDRINILNATFHAMSRAVRALQQRAALNKEQGKILPGSLFHLVIDGNQRIPAHILEEYSPERVQQQTVIKGDALVPCISAASILAKTFRDRLMVALDKRWPDYGFAVHKGYGTAAHCTALIKHGPCAQHRLTFRKVRPEGTAAQNSRQLSLL